MRSWPLGPPLGRSPYMKKDHLEENTMTDLDPNDLMSFTEVCKRLPGVKPRVLRQQVREASLLGKGLKLGTERLTKEEVEELQITAYRGRSWAPYEVDVVSPKGARALVRAYRAGALCKKPQEVSPELLEYIESEEALRAKVRARQDAERAYREKITNPQSIKESEFTFSLLNDVFWAHGLKGNCSMVIDGITVTKSVLPFYSNSGKSRDFRVTFSWTGRDGERRTLSKESTYERNRRNDEKRNFGLPE